MHPYSQQQQQQQQQQNQQQQQQQQQPSQYHHQFAVPVQQPHSFGSSSFHQIQQQHHPNAQPLSPTSYTSASPGMASLMTSTSPGMTTTTTATTQSWATSESPDKHGGYVSASGTSAGNQHPFSSSASSSSVSASAHALYALPDLTSKVYWPGQDFGVGKEYDHQQHQHQQQMQQMEERTQLQAAGNSSQQQQQGAAHRHIRQNSMTSRNTPTLELPSTTTSSHASSKPQVGLADILADDFYQEAVLRRRGSLAPSTSGTQLHSPSVQGHTPPGGALGVPLGEEDGSADQLSKEDPLATQVWKLFARTKATLPHAQRMENLTWRMMAMALRKRREAANLPGGVGHGEVPSPGKEVSLKEMEDVGKMMIQEAAARALLPAGEQEDVKALTLDGQSKAKISLSVTAASATSSNSTQGSTLQGSLLEKERGRNIDKGRKPKMRVEGFHTADGEEEGDFADGMDWRAASRSRSRAPGAMEWRAASQSRSRSRPPLPLGLGSMNMPFQHIASQGMLAQQASALPAGYSAGSLGPVQAPRGGVRDPGMWIPQTFEESPPATHEGASQSSAIAIPNASQGSQLENEHGENGVQDEEKDGEAMAMASGSAGIGSGVSLLTKSLQMFSESPPSVGVDFFRGHINAGSALVGPHFTLSQSLREKGIQFDGSRRPSQPSIHQQLQLQAEREQELQDQQTLQSLMPLPVDESLPSSLPAYHHLLQQQQQHQQLFDTSHASSSAVEEQWQGGMRSALPTGFPRRVRKTSFDHTVARDEDEVNAVQDLGRHQVDGRPVPPPGSKLEMRRASIQLEASIRAQEQSVDAANADLRGQLEPHSPYATHNFSLPNADRLFLNNDLSASMPFGRLGVPGIDFPFGHPLARSASVTGAVDFPRSREDDRLDDGAADNFDTYAYADEVDPTIQIASAAAAAAIDESVERFATAAAGGALMPNSFEDSFDTNSMGMHAGIFFPINSYG
ncbi:hypothetical protein FRC16_004079, partial [Serendipita sp. 398]